MTRTDGRRRRFRRPLGGGGRAGRFRRLEPGRFVWLTCVTMAAAVRCDDRQQNGARRVSERGVAIADVVLSAVGMCSGDT